MKEGFGLGFVSPPPGGIEVRVSALLPYEQTAAACSIETREEVSVLTGDLINVIKDNKKGIIYVSKEIFEKLSKI